MQQITATAKSDAPAFPQFSNLFTSFFSTYRTTLADSATESLISARASLLESKDFSAADKIEDAILAAQARASGTAYASSLDRSSIGSDKPFPSGNAHACRKVLQAREILASAGDQKGVERADEIMEKVFNRACLGSVMLGREWHSA